MKRFALSIILLLLPTLKTIASTPVVVPGIEREDYFISMLELALSYHPDKQYQVEFIDYDVPKLRAFRLIESKQGIDLIAAGATNARQKTLRSIKIPLLKGLFGWRAALVHRDNLNLLHNAKTDAQFKRLTAGQLLTWSDVKILESNGIKVVKGAHYRGLFSMLSKHRFDYFPRSILEVKSEYRENRHLDLAIEPNILLHYPTAYYFYVNQQNIELAEDLRIGLELAISDGKFEALFQQNFGQIIQSFKIQNRRVIELHNPNLPNDVPLGREELWLSLYPTKEQVQSGLAKYYSD